jgi:hypothetical protein
MNVWKRGDGRSVGRSVVWFERRMNGYERLRYRVEVLRSCWGDFYQGEPVRSAPKVTIRTARSGRILSIVDVVRLAMENESCDATRFS